MKSMISVIMAGIVSIYGLVIAILINGNIKQTGYTDYKGFTDLAAGLTVGICGLAGGIY